MKNLNDRNFEKYGVILMAVAFFAVAIARPLIAHAECDHGDWGKARHGEFFETQMKSLHDKLKLSEAQEASWKEFVEKSKPAEHHPKMKRSEMSKLTTPERLDRMLSMSKERQQRMETHAAAVKSFYAKLTPEQQKTFDASFRPHRQDHEPHEQ